MRRKSVCFGARFITVLSVKALPNARAHTHTHLQLLLMSHEHDRALQLFAQQAQDALVHKV